MEERDPNAEGQGASERPPLISPDTPRRDLRMIRAHARYGLSERVRNLMVDEAAKIVETASEKQKRLKLAGILALATLDRIDVEREKMDQRDEHREQDRTGPNADTSGTALTPDMDVAEMDASVPRAPAIEAKPEP